MALLPFTIPLLSPGDGMFYDTCLQFKLFPLTVSIKGAVHLKRHRPVPCKRLAGQVRRHPLCRHCRCEAIRPRR